MKLLNKQARKYLLSLEYPLQPQWASWKPVFSNYIGNHSKHMRGTPQPRHTKGKYLTARDRNRY